MNAPAVFPLAPRPRGQGPGDLVALLPARLSGNGVSVDVSGLVDTGATFSVLPHDLGLRFGLDWNALTQQVALGGRLTGVPAKVALIEITVAPFPTAPFLFAWANVNTVPILFGMATFFLEFDVCVLRGRGEFHVQPRTP